MLRLPSSRRNSVSTYLQVTFFLKNISAGQDGKRLTLTIPFIEAILMLSSSNRAATRHLAAGLA
jgi:hypothetical protein